MMGGQQKSWKVLEWAHLQKRFLLLSQRKATMGSLRHGPESTASVPKEQSRESGSYLTYQELSGLGRSVGNRLTLQA